MNKRRRYFLKLIVWVLVIFLLQPVLSSCGSDKSLNGEVTGSFGNLEATGRLESSSQEIQLPEGNPILNTSISQVNDYSFDEEISALFKIPDDYEPLSDSSIQKIRNDLQTGKITEEEAAKLAIFSEYSPKILPESYIGEGGYDSAQYEIRYLLKNWDLISQQTRDAVLPYLLPLNDPGSIFNPSYNKEKNTVSIKSIIDYATIDAYAGTLDLGGDTFTHDGQTIEIMYSMDSDLGDSVKQAYEETTKLVKETIIHSWDMYKPLMKTTLNKPLQVELLPMAEGAFGEEFTKDNIYRIRINSKYMQNKKLIKSTTAHELYHAFQEELGLGFSETEEKWLTEATAVWAEHYSFNDLNFEHIRHPGFFRTLDKERIAFGQGFEYVSYMLFYYLTDYEKINFIYDITKEAATKGNSSIRKYLNEKIPKIKDTYGNFAACNWNAAPTKKYYDYEAITGTPSGKCLYKKAMQSDDEDSQTVSLKPGAIKYYFYAFRTSDPDLAHVKITFDKKFEGDKHVKRQALIRIGGVWKLEDWSGVDERTYCRKRELKNEKIEALVLIYSNGDFEKGDKEAVDDFVVRTEKCPSEMEITLDSTITLSNGQISWECTTHYTETLEIKDHSFFLTKSASHNMTGKGTMEGAVVIDTTGGFQYGADQTTLGQSMTRVLLRTQENIEGAKEAYAKYGITENTPSTGIFMTIPALPAEGMPGHTTLSFPPPVGTQNIDTPFPLDGISQIVGFVPEKMEWSPEGFNASRELDYFSYKSPVTSMFSMDASTFMEQYSSLSGGAQLPEGMKSR